MGKPDSKLVVTPVSDLLGTPSKSGSNSENVVNGEPNLPKRTDSPNACPEVIYDKAGPLVPPKR